MKLFNITGILLLISCVAFSQQILLKGSVSIQNSKYETGEIQYVKDAYVEAFKAKPANTDDNGNFSLQFVGLPPGMSIPLKVERQDMEVVNSRDLEDVVIGRKGDLKIYMARKGKLMETRLAFYEVNEKALYAWRDAEIGRLQADNEESKKALTEIEKHFNQKLNNRSEAIALLRNEVEEIKTQLPEYARELAVKNLDFASDLYIEAYEAFKKGAVEKAIAILDDKKLEAMEAQALEGIAKGKRIEKAGREMREKGLLQVQQVISSYELKIQTLRLSFKYSDIEAYYKKIIAMHEENDFDQLELAKWYDKLGEIHFDVANYVQALEDFQKALDIRRKNLNPEIPSLTLVSSYHHMAVTHAALGDYKKGLEYQLKTLTILETFLKPKDPMLANSYDHIGFAYLFLGDYRKSLKYQNKALAIYDEIWASDNPKLAKAYNIIAGTYQNLGDFGNSRKYQLKSTAIAEKVLALHTPEATGADTLSIPLANLVVSNSTLRIPPIRSEYQMDMDYQQRALFIAETVLEFKNPPIVETYINMAEAYRSIGSYKKSLEYFHKAVAIQKEQLGPYHISLAISYYNMAVTYGYMEEYAKNLAYASKTVSMTGRMLDSKHPYRAIVYNNFGNTYRVMGDYENAIEYYKNAIKILEERSEANRTDLASSHSGIARALLSTGDAIQALKHQEKAMKIFKATLPKKAPDIKEGEKLLKNIKKAVQEQEK